MKAFKVGVIGIGRVGLPLALSLNKNGVSTIGFDINQEIVDCVNKKKMPFNEEGYDEIIKKLDFFATTDLSRIKEVENIIITVGTPLLAHIETDLTQINIVLKSITDYLEPNHNLILRSTVAPKTTNYIKRYIETNTNFKIGKNIFLSFCPERIAEGKALKELESLPQVIGSEDKLSAQMAEDIFCNLSSKIFHTNYVSAELVKLFNNTYRYINFSISNQFAMIAEDFDASIYDIIEMTNTDYPRGQIPSPGLTAGTCLRKDFGMINETSSYSDLLLNSWKVNEFIPKFLVQNILKEKEIFGKKIGVLGYSFKMDTDDTRDSLVPKMIRYIEREVPEKVFIHEPCIEGLLDKRYENSALNEVLENCEIIFIALNHSIFKENINDIINRSKNNCVFVDFWNISGKNKIVFTK
tara:strand:- start:1327 stop:2559 length:1233 start_codon:yes stop_codon:yes gene_type:complete